jgi:hypothetical protein
MRVELRNTSKVVVLAGADGSTMHARVWEGTTDNGVPVIAFITRIAAQRDSDLSEFEAELAGAGHPVGRRTGLAGPHAHRLTTLERDREPVTGVDRRNRPTAGHLG